MGKQPEVAEMNNKKLLQRNLRQFFNYKAMSQQTVDK